MAHYTRYDTIGKTWASQIITTLVALLGDHNLYKKLPKKILIVGVWVAHALLPIVSYQLTLL
jgi:Zn-dependent protease with chaperone function